MMPRAVVCLLLLRVCGCLPEPAMAQYVPPCRPRLARSLRGDQVARVVTNAPATARIGVPLHGLRAWSAGIRVAPGDVVVGDNEPYDGALRGDTLFRHCMKPGIAHALIEIRQDEIGDADGIARWVDRLAPIFARLNADEALHTYEIHPSRTGPY